jgi:hypothetical protein
MPETNTHLVNVGLAKLGGAGSGGDGSGLIADIDSLTDVNAVRCKAIFETCRQKVITDLANSGCPFKETLKFADLGTDLKQYDFDISSIAIGAGTTYYVTVTTTEAHGLATGNTRYLTGIRGTGGIESLNNTLKTVTVTGLTTFTLDSTTGAAAWVHTASTGKISQLPAIGEWEYAFDLPSDCFVVVSQLDEVFASVEEKRREYNFDTMLNRSSTGKILVTNDLCNAVGDSAFIQYCIDQADPTLFSYNFRECLTTLLAAELAAFLVTNDGQKRRYFLFQEYSTCVQSAKVFNQSQFQNSKKITPDYLGERTGGVDVV